MQTYTQTDSYKQTDRQTDTTPMCMQRVNYLRNIIIIIVKSFSLKIIHIIKVIVARVL